MQNIRTYLVSKGIKPSVQRLNLMKYLMEHHIHPTVDEIYEALYPTMPTLSKTTIYSTLKLFAEKGAIQTITIDPKNARFDADIAPHAHFQCECCGMIKDVELAAMPSCKEVELEGLKITETQVYLKGLCNNCYKQEKND